MHEHIINNTIMATVSAYIRTLAKKADKVYVRFRLSDGKTQLYHKSKLEIDPKVWDPKKQEIKAKVIYDSNERTIFNNAVSDRKKLIRSIYDNSHELTSEQLDFKIDVALHPERYISEDVVEVPKTYFEFFDQFLSQHKVSEGRHAHYKVLKRALQRYGLYRKITLDIHTMTKETLQDIEAFIRDETNVFKTHPEIYELVPESRDPKPRGQNTISGILSRYRTFCLWLVKEKITQNNPFDSFSIESEVYGTPYYLTIKERNDLYKHNFSKRPDLAIQRDIFIFHCMIGCRIGDLYRLTTDSIINNAIEYIASKTKNDNPITVRVPLNSTAKEILKKYPATTKGAPIFPFISGPHYNAAIREIFQIAGITRIVTVLDSATRKEVKKHLHEVASSHLARRTFIGNLYKKVKDPNLVGSLSGHKEGSKAFARYREIDEEMKLDLVKLLE